MNQLSLAQLVRALAPHLEFILICSKIHMCMEPDRCAVRTNIGRIYNKPYETWVQTSNLIQYCSNLVIQTIGAISKRPKSDLNTSESQAS